MSLLPGLEVPEISLLSLAADQGVHCIGHEGNRENVYTAGFKFLERLAGDEIGQHCFAITMPGQDMPPVRRHGH